MTLDSLSNKEAVEIKDEWIEDAVNQFRDALKRQLKPDTREFNLRMSNLGRPLCQLQNEKIDSALVSDGGKSAKSRDPYNHILRMIIGDATEIAVNVIVKASGVNITNSKSKHEVMINGKRVPGEDDIEIDGKVYDIKSASPYAYSHKWNEGWNGVYYGDSFGYVAQLWAYAEKDPDKMGGWIVVDKSSGELKVVEAKPTIDQLKELEKGVSYTVEAITNDLPFQKLFEPEVETYYKKETGNHIVPFVCTFCSYMGKCWPDATFEQKIGSKPKWYVKG
jgi:hypothetical protein